MATHGRDQESCGLCLEISMLGWFGHQSGIGISLLKTLNLGTLSNEILSDTWSQISNRMCFDPCVSVTHLQSLGFVGGLLQMTVDLVDGRYGLQRPFISPSMFSYAALIAYLPKARQGLIVTRPRLGTITIQHPGIIYRKSSVCQRYMRQYWRPRDM